ncbi:MAG: hypothetical protein AAF648_11835, partial [Pseudomonadota bacterium]
SPQADSGVFGNLPDVLVCSVSDPTEVLPWDQLVFYVSARVEGGGTLYKSLTANPILITIEGDGQVVAPNLADCDGKSLSELRRAGQAADFASR